MGFSQRWVPVIWGIPWVTDTGPIFGPTEIDLPRARGFRRGYNTNPAPRRRLRQSTTVKYELKPMSTATTAPWASALRVKYASLMGSAERATAVELMQAGLAPKTAQNYDSKLSKVISFCAGRGLSPMPATTETVLEYIGYLAREGTVHVDSAQPYLSCINTAHVAVGLVPPALGPAVEQARKGWRQLIVHAARRGTDACRCRRTSRGEY